MIYLVFDGQARVYRFAHGRCAHTGAYTQLGDVAGYVNKSDAILHAHAYGLKVDESGRVYPTRFALTVQ